MGNQRFVGNKGDIYDVVVRNNEASIVIPVGAPVILDFSATSSTNYGKDVKSAASLAAAEQGNFFGIALAQLNPGDIGYSQVFGYTAIARVVLAGRSATGATWSSIAAGSIGEYLTIGTGTGSGAAVPDQALVRVGTAAMTVAQFARLAESFASTDTQASSVGPQSVTVWTTTRKVFLRLM